MKSLQHPVFRLAVLSAVAVTMFAPVGLAAPKGFDPKASGQDKNFVMKATQGGNAEVLMGNIALKNTQTPEIRQIARQLVIDHGKAGSELAKIALNARIMVPAGTDANHRGAAEKMARLKEKKFDAAYVGPQLKDHEDAIALFRKEAKEGHNPALRKFAAETLPTLEHHRDMLRDASKKHQG